MPASPSSQSPGEVASWDAVPGSLLVLDAAAAARHVNSALCDFLGMPRVDALGSGWQRALAPCSREPLLTALASHAGLRLQLQLRDHAGRWIWLDCMGLRRADDWVCLLHDVTAGKAAMHSQSELFRLLADNVPALVAYYRLDDLRCQFANKAYSQRFGGSEQSVVGQTLAQIIGERSALEIEPQIERFQATRRPVSYEREMTGRDGRRRWIEVSLLPHLDEHEQALGAFVLISDITHHREVEFALRESEERLAKFMQASIEGIVFHRDGVIVDVNPPMCRMLGYTLSELLGHQTIEFVAPEHVAQAAAVITSGEETSYESVLVGKQGQRVPVEIIARMMLRNGEPLRMTIVRDIRDRRAAQARIRHLAHHDALTGLPNRTSFMELLQVSMLGARKQRTRIALLFIDLDHFKRVNDSLGHLAGDTLLRTVATRIVGNLRTTDIVARFGGDEFMVLLPGMPTDASQRSDVEEVARKLLAAIEAPVDAEGRPISVTSSIGIALYPGDGEAPMELVEHADSAMYRAKVRGRANAQFFDPVMATAAYAALVMEGQLAQALERGEFELYFQPQVRAADGVPIGAEALIRWNHPERGLLLPDQFIPVAEQRRLMLPIGQWVLQEAVRCATRWQAMGLNVAPVAVNLSTVQFHSIGFIDAVAQVLPPDGVSEGLIELELTERTLMDDLAAVKQRLLRLKALGLRISVDDFGTGYSSLAHLKALPIDKVKIDRSFVEDLPDNHDSAAITRAIIQMGRSLGMMVIAEGVETVAQRDFLAAQHCDELQGMLISPPLPLARFEAWMAERRAAAA